MAEEKKGVTAAMCYLSESCGPADVAPGVTWSSLLLVDWLGSTASPVLPVAPVASFCSMSTNSPLTDL